MSDAISDTLSRRKALKRLVALGGAALLPAGRQAAAAALPHLSPTNTEAQELGYVADASRIDQSNNPLYAAGESCANCLHLMGSSGQAWRPCDIFPGFLVSQRGWCTAYAKRT